jgi:hypothetical protein
MLHEYHVIYSVRYYPRFHVTAIGLGRTSGSHTEKIGRTPKFGLNARNKDLLLQPATNPTFTSRDCRSLVTTVLPSSSDALTLEYMSSVLDCYMNSTSTAHCHVKGIRAYRKASEGDCREGDSIAILASQ